MKLRGTKATLAALLSGVLILSACTSDADVDDTAAPQDTAATTEPTDEATDEATDEGTDEATEDPGGVDAGGNTEACLQDVGITETADGQVSLTVGPGNWSGYNATTSRTYSTYNNAIADQMFSGFVYYGVDGTICTNDDFGTFEVLNEDPLEIQYTIADDAQWSDGVPVTINDYLLDWAAQNPEFLEGGTFDHVSTSFAEYVPEGPQGEVGSKTFTVTYSEQYPDWRLIVGGTLPAHIAAERSGVEPDALAQAILDRDADTVGQVAEFWNNGWIYNPGELPDMADTPSSGPYMLKEGGWQADTALTLTANDNYWGTPAGTQDLIFRFVEDAAMVQALENGDVDVIRPQATVDTVQQLQNSNATLEQYSTLTWEHLDFNFREAGEIETVDDEGEPTGETTSYPGSIFSDGQGGLALREAFALCVPRQTIVDSLIAPINPDTVLMNARESFPFQDDYDEVVGAAYDGRFDQVDIAAAQEKFAEAGVEGEVDVRIGYFAGNQRRAETVQAIQASCSEVGFNVTDASSATFFDVELVNGDYEVALFAWAGSGQIASGRNIYHTGLPQNYGHYSNPTVDEAFNVLASSLDNSVHVEQKKIIEQELWDTLYGIPLYAHPGTAAHDPALQNFRPTATQSGPNWNAYQWVVS